MPRSTSRLRRWLVGSAVLLCSVVAGMYFLARSRQRNVLNEVPGDVLAERLGSTRGAIYIAPRGFRT